MNDERAREVREHFLQEGYRRMFDQVRRKWESIGRVGGQIRLEQVTDEERRRISGLLWDSCQTGGVAVIRLVDLDKVLRESRWEVGLEELLPLLTGKPLVSKKQRREQKTSAWDSFCEQLSTGCLRSQSKTWWKRVRTGEALGAKAVRMLFDQNPDRAQSAAKLCLHALDELPCWREAVERLPVFANRLSGNPHALDADTTSGRWLYQALCDLFGVPVESASEWKREVLQEAGILTDELASHVMVLGVGTLRNDPWEHFFEQAAVMRMPLLLPLAFFKQKVAWRHVERLYVVENPAVFQSLIDLFPNERELPPLVCTSGQPSVAALWLLDAFAAMGTQICYSGDFDWKGLEIACGLQKRYREAFSAWRMGTDDYRSCDSVVVFEEEHLNHLLEIEIAWDECLVQTVKQRNCKVFQESLLEKLLADLMR